MWYNSFINSPGLQENTIKWLSGNLLHPEVSSWKMTKGFLEESATVNEPDEVLLRHLLERLNFEKEPSVTITPDSLTANRLTEAFERNRRRRREKRVPDYTFVERKKDGSYILPSFATAAHIEVIYKTLSKYQASEEKLGFQYPIVHMCCKSISDDQNEKASLFDVEDYWAYEMLTGVNAALVITSAICDTKLRKSVVDLALELIPLVLREIYPQIHRVPAIYWKLSFLKSLTEDFLDFTEKNECIFDRAEKMVYDSSDFSEEEKKGIKRNPIFRTTVINILASTMEQRSQELILEGIRKTTGFDTVNDNSFNIGLWIPQNEEFSYWAYRGEGKPQEHIRYVSCSSQKTITKSEKWLPGAEITENIIAPAAFQYISDSMKNYIENELNKKLYPPKGRKMKPDYRNKYEHTFSRVYPVMAHTISHLNYR